MNKTLTETLFDEISTRDSIISDLTNEKDIALEQFNAAVDALNEAYREIDRLNQPDEAEATEEMVNEMLDICGTEEESWMVEEEDVSCEDCECDDCADKDDYVFGSPYNQIAQVKVNVTDTLDSIVAGALVSYDKRAGSLTPNDLLQLAELKRHYSK